MNQTMQIKENKKPHSNATVMSGSKDVSKLTPSDKQKVRKDMNLAEVVFRYPEAAEVLMDYDLHCVGCGGSSFDTIEVGAKLHGMSDEEIDEMLQRINEAVFFRE